jgi:hypothetical protein
VTSKSGYILFDKRQNLTLNKEISDSDNKLKNLDNVKVLDNAHGRIEVLHHHVTAARLDGRNNEIFLHENELNSSIKFLPSNLAAFT